MAVNETDGDEEASGDDSQRVQPNLLAPDRASFLLDDIGDGSSERSEHNVEKTKHGGPATGTCLTKLGEVLEVVAPQNRVDGKFGAEGAEVACCDCEGLGRQDDRHGFFKCRLDYNFTLGRFQHVCFVHGDLVI